ncbi:MAG: extracellular solute-binding protein [Lachnospiraceae bacterium]|nr:extracellular solute-binding protein [Lachnospiraceae bacterium]
MKKRLLALLLVGCMSASLLACGAKNEEQTTSSSTTQSTTAGTTAATTEAATAATTEPEETNPFKGKEITIFKSDPETVHSNLQGWDYTHGEQLTIDEWLLENEVTANYLVASSDLSAMMAAVNSKNGPDLMSTNTNFPNIANIGLVQPIDEYYDELAEICGTEYLDLMTYQGHCYGVCMPLAGTRLFQYNKTLFENMGVKTPREYFEEGNWTWETLMKCAEEITRDTDGDGVNDIVGISTDSLGQLVAMFNPIEEGEDGKLKAVLDSEKNRTFIEMVYKGVNETGAIVPAGTEGLGSYKNPDSAIYPAMGAMNLWAHSLNDCYSELSNGDILESVPLPKYSADEEYITQIHYIYWVIPSSCDDMDMTISLLKEIIKFNLADMEQMSDGNIPSEFEGLKGTTEYSEEWIQLREAFINDSNEATKARPGYDAEYIASVQQALYGGTMVMDRIYNGVTRNILIDGKYKNLYLLPPASSIAELQAVLQGECDTYNSKYVY